MQVSSAKGPAINGFVLALFCILGLGRSLALEHFQLCQLVFLRTN